jgi:hypothetical protein
MNSILDIMFTNVIIFISRCLIQYKKETRITGQSLIDSYHGFNQSSPAIESSSNPSPVGSAFNGRVSVLAPRHPTTASANFLTC